MEEQEKRIWDLWSEGQFEDVLQMFKSDPCLLSAEVMFGDLLILELLITASGQGLIEVVEELVSLGADPNGRTAEGETPLLAAARDGHSTVVERLIALGADPNDERYLTPWPVHAAVWSGDVETLRILIKSGANPNQDDLDASYPLHEAARAARPEIVGELLSWKARVDQVDELDYPPLWHAIRAGCYESVRLLVEAGASLIERHAFSYFTGDIRRRVRSEDPQWIAESIPTLQSVGALSAVGLAELMCNTPAAREVVHWDTDVIAESVGGVYDDGVDREPLRGGEYDRVYEYLRTKSR